MSIIKVAWYVLRVKNMHPGSPSDPSGTAAAEAKPRYVQIGPTKMAPLLNKHYVNEVCLTGQNLGNLKLYSHGKKDTNPYNISSM